MTIRGIALAFAAILLATACRAGPGEVTLTVVVAGPGQVLVGEHVCAFECAFSVAPGSTFTLEALPDAGAEFTGWDACPASTGASCGVTVASDLTVTARFDLEPEPEPGSVSVSFVGMPAPWSGQGYGVLTPVGVPAGAVSVVASGTIDGLAPGSYVFEPQLLPLCDVDYIPVPSTVQVTVAEGATVPVNVTYHPSSLGVLGFRARVVGIHSVVSITEDVELGATLVLTEDGLKTFGCLRYFELEGFEQGPVGDADLRLGVAADYYLDAGSAVAAIVVGPTVCAPAALPDGPGSVCRVFLDGSHPLSGAQRSAVVAGASFLRVDVPAARPGTLVAAVPGDGVEPSAGGTLVIDLDGFGSGEVCVEGPQEAPLPPTFCVSGTTALVDRLSGTYVVVTIDDGPPDTPGFLVEGDPATVSPGQTATIRVTE